MPLSHDLLPCASQALLLVIPPLMFHLRGLCYLINSTEPLCSIQNLVFWSVVRKLIPVSKVGICAKVDFVNFPILQSHSVTFPVDLKIISLCTVSILKLFIAELVWLQLLNHFQKHIFRLFRFIKYLFTFYSHQNTVQLFFLLYFQLKMQKILLGHYICLIFIISNLIISDYPFLDLLSLICDWLQGNFCIFPIIFYQRLFLSSSPWCQKPSSCWVVQGFSFLISHLSILQTR